MFSLEQIIEWLLVYKYIVLFPVMVIEGPIITIIAGFLSSLELLNIYIAFFVVVVADLLGDFIYYSIGRWGRKKFIDKWGKYIGIDPLKIEKLENHFLKHRKKTLIIGKISHAIGAPILVAAGIVKVPIIEFLWVNFLATLPKSFLFIFIGYHFGQAYVRLDQYLEYFTITFIIIGITFVLIYYLYNKYKLRYRAFLDKLKRKNILDVE